MIGTQLFEFKIVYITLQRMKALVLQYVREPNNAMKNQDMLGAKLRN